MLQVWHFALFLVIFFYELLHKICSPLSTCHPTIYLTHTPPLTLACLQLHPTRVYPPQVFPEPLSPISLSTCNFLPLLQVSSASTLTHLPFYLQLQSPSPLAHFRCNSSPTQSVSSAPSPLSPVSQGQPPGYPPAAAVQW